MGTQRGGNDGLPNAQTDQRLNAHTCRTDHARRSGPAAANLDSDVTGIAKA